jgi:hypothetical protein
MPALRPVRAALVMAAIVSLGGACAGDDARPGGDAGPDAAVAADGGASDVPAAVPTVDFTAVGCRELDSGKPQCRGTAPLAITFVPIPGGEVSRFLWDFGDQTRSSERTPTHVYALPGTYDVTLIGAPGLASQTHAAFVVVAPNPLAGPCDVDGQCAPGLTCQCGASTRCPAAFTRGFCTKPCGANDPCPAGAVCAQPGMPVPGTPEAWRAPQCLRACERDGDCGAGQSCRLLPVAGGGWTRACFVGFPLDVGASCRSGNGQLQDGACVTGLCADLGALGVCTRDCRQGGCPAGSACAAFNDGRRLCLRTCGAGFDCKDDPLLACAAPGRTGKTGFTLVAGGAESTSCAPRPCEGDRDCAPAGVCPEEPGSGQHCALPARP